MESESSKSSITIAVIGALGAILVAWITTYGAIAVSKPEAMKVKQELEEISDLKKVANLPIGTVVSSLLTPSLYSKEVGDTLIFNPEKTQWVLADHKMDISLSRYGKLLNERYTPDFRGMFIRGVNEDRNDGKEDPELDRQAGSYQPDNVKPHRHKINGVRSIGGSGFIAVEAHALDSQGSIHTEPNETKPIEGDETRPKNIAVYYYLKIN